jgi:hypothetical protein
MSSMKQLAIRDSDHSRLNKIRGLKIASEDKNITLADVVGFLLDFYEKELPSKTENPIK